MGEKDAKDHKKIYVFGFAFSGEYSGANLNDLLNEADIKMYENKIRVKKAASKSR